MGGTGRNQIPNQRSYSSFRTGITGVGFLVLRPKKKLNIRCTIRIMGMICYYNVLKCNYVDIDAQLFQKRYLTNIKEKNNI